MSIGKRVDILVTENGKPLHYQASQIGISETYLYQLRRGHRIPTLFIACCICDYYGVSLDWLAGRSDKRNG